MRTAAIAGLCLSACIPSLIEAKPTDYKPSVETELAPFRVALAADVDRRQVFQRALRAAVVLGFEISSESSDARAFQAKIEFADGETQDYLQQEALKWWQEKWLHPGLQPSTPRWAETRVNRLLVVSVAVGDTEVVVRAKVRRCFSSEGVSSQCAWIEAYVPFEVDQLRHLVDSLDGPTERLPATAPAPKSSADEPQKQLRPGMRADAAPRLW